MKKFNYKGVLDQLIKEYPHEIDKVERVVMDAKRVDPRYEILSFEEIINNTEWDSDEKARLIRTLGYNKTAQFLDHLNEYGYEETMDAYTHVISFDNLSGFEALMKTFNDIDDNRCLTKESAYLDIIERITRLAREEKTSKYIKAALSILNRKELEGLMKPYYAVEHKSGIYNISVIIDVIKTKDLELIKQYLPYVEDINMYISEAVATGNIEIVKYFLSLGADINYCPKELFLNEVSPLKRAIDNNDFEMVQYLANEAGADINLNLGEDELIGKEHFEFEGLDFDDEMDLGNMENKHIENLKFLKTSSPLKYALTLDEDYLNTKSQKNEYLKFKGHSCARNRMFKDIDSYETSKKLKERREIVDFLFDKTKDKTNIDVTNLIAFTFAIKDDNQFLKYKDYAIEKKEEIRFDELFKLYFDFNLKNNRNMTIGFLDFLSHCGEDKLIEQFFHYYLNERSNIKSYNTIYIKDFEKIVLQSLPQEKRSQFCIVPYCRDLESLDYLTSMGFDVNQVDEDGWNILFHLLANKRTTVSMNGAETLLFNNLLERIDLSHKDKNEKNVLYYALQKVDTNDEGKLSKEVVTTLTIHELLVAKLITKMKRKDVYNKNTVTVLEKRMEHNSGYGNKIWYEFIYQNHKELFEALVSKGFVFNKTLLNHIFSKLYPEDIREQRYLEGHIDIDASREFLFKRLDRNTEIRVWDINKKCQESVAQIYQQDTTFEDYKNILKNFQKEVDSLKDFYNNIIPKKHNPEKYLEFVREKYQTNYEDILNDNYYLVILIIAGLRSFGNDKLEEILSLCPNFDINSWVWEENVGINYYQYFYEIEKTYLTQETGDLDDIVSYDLDGNPIYRYQKNKVEQEVRYEPEEVLVKEDTYNISFTGGLMQYAILVNDIKLVKKLQEKGARLDFINEDGNYTWNYVNSIGMFNYMESILGPKGYDNLGNEEKIYYLNLLHHN